jgi:uncharacterized SAM-binding protein YcdF (DUF218 family)
MILFSIKKLISYWLMPIPFCLSLLVIGCLLAWTKKYLKHGKIILTINITLLLFLSNTRISTWLIEPLENKFPAIPSLNKDTIPYKLRICKYIVVLGSGNSENSERSALSRLSNSGLARITEGTRLALILPNTHIIVSGPAIGDFPTHASIVKDAATELSLDPSRIIKIETARDTEEESQAIKNIVGTEPIALVTSAWHMPRAAYLLQKAGVNFIPCPTDFTVRKYAPQSKFEFSQINASLTRSTWAIHERLGMIWLRIKEVF